MVKNHNIVGGSSHLISFQSQKKSKMRAFSIAEAMITLTIFAVIAASAAPLISKQIKNNTLGDIAFSALNQKTEELNKTKWYQTPDKKSITRPDGNVGIGVSAGTNPKAKLDVAGNLRVSVPDTGSIANCDAEQTDCPIRAKIGGVNRFVIRNTGGILLRPKDNETKLAIYDEEGNVQLAFYGNNFLGVQHRKRGVGTAAESDVYAFNVNEKGQVFLNPPTRAEVRTEPDEFTRNDAYAFAIRYPEDSDPRYDCGDAEDDHGACTPTINDGYTETAVWASNGTLYINSITSADSHAAFVIRNGVVPRMIVRQNGSILLRPTDEMNSNALVLMKPMGTKKADGSYDTDVYAHIKTDGSAYFAGNVAVGGELANAQLDTKFAKINNDLSNAKELIAELKLENADIKAENKELKEKLASFEFQLAEIVAINNLQKIVQKK